MHVRLTIACAIIAYCLIIYFILTAMAPAHDAIPTRGMPMGWSYPWSCCSGQDCRQVNTKESKVKILETPDGYKISTTGEVIPYSKDTRLKTSPDSVYHWCSGGGLDTSKTICLFAPSKGT